MRIGNKATRNRNPGINLPQTYNVHPVLGIFTFTTSTLLVFFSVNPQAGFCELKKDPDPNMSRYGSAQHCIRQIKASQFCMRLEKYRIQQGQQDFSIPN
jgi:hypothetical protein